VTGQQIRSCCVLFFFILLSLVTCHGFSDQMSATEMDAFKKMLNAKFPSNPAIMAKAVAARNS